MSTYILPSYLNARRLYKSSRNTLKISGIYSSILIKVLVISLILFLPEEPIKEINYLKRQLNVCVN